MATCAGCRAPVGRGGNFCGRCGLRLPEIPPHPGDAPMPSLRGVRGHRWPRWVQALAGVLAAGVVITVVVVVTGGSGTVNGLASSYTCTSTEASLQGTQIVFTSRGNAHGRGLSGSVDLPDGTMLEFSDGEIDLSQRGHAYQVLSFGNLQVDTAVDLSAVAQRSSNGDIVFGSYLTCLP